MAHDWRDDRIKELERENGALRADFLVLSPEREVETIASSEFARRFSVARKRSATEDEDTGGGAICEAIDLGCDTIDPRLRVHLVRRLRRYE